MARRWLRPGDRKPLEWTPGLQQPLNRLENRALSKDVQAVTHAFDELYAVSRTPRRVQATGVRRRQKAIRGTVDDDNGHTDPCDR